MHCTNCNHVMKKCAVREYAYDESGLPSVKLYGGIEKLHCAHCDHEMTSFQAIGKLHRALAAAIASKTTRLLPAEIRFLRDHLGMTNEEFARTMGVTPYQSSRWMSGPMSESAERLLRMLVVSNEEDVAAIRRVVATLRHGTREGKEELLRARFSRGNWMVGSRA